jgi:hypothetical protein
MQTHHHHLQFGQPGSETPLTPVNEIEAFMVIAGQAWLADSLGKLGLAQGRSGPAA